MNVIALDVQVILSGSQSNTQSKIGVEQVVKLISEALNKILNPDEYPLIEGSTRTITIPIELGGLGYSDGSLSSREDAIRSKDYISVTSDKKYSINLSVDIGTEFLRVCGYDENYNFVKTHYVSLNEIFEVSEQEKYIKFYTSAISDLTVVAKLTERGQDTIATFVKQYLGKSHAVYHDTIDSETMHKLVIEALGLNDNEYNIVEVKAPKKNPFESTLCLMNSGNNTTQFVDFSSMRYDETSRGSVEIVPQARGNNTPLPEFSIRYNDGKGAGRVKKFTVQPDSIPIDLTSKGVVVRRNNNYNNQATATELVTINLADLYDRVRQLESKVALLVDNKVITTVDMEEGRINSTDGSNSEAPSTLRTPDFIPIVGGKKVSFKNSIGNIMRTFVYDSSQTLITGWNSGYSYAWVENDSSITYPENAKYIKLYVETNETHAEVTVSFTNQ